MFRVQKKLERHFIYRGWTLARAFAYSAALFSLLRGLIPAALRSDFSAMGPLVGRIGSALGVWLVFEFIVEKLFALHARPKRVKADPKSGKPARKIPVPRIFYRRVGVSHLLPGRASPLLLGLSEQDLEYQVWFRVYLAARYLVYVAVGLSTILVLAADPIAQKSWGGEGYLGALVPLFLMRAVESALLYLFLGTVMSGEDIHGTKTTRFFAFEPTASFTKRLTLPIVDRKGWLVSLHPFRDRAPKVAWWVIRLTAIVSTVMVAEAANTLQIRYPKFMTPAMSWLIPFALIYFYTAFERAAGYLIFFPTSKKKKKNDDTFTKAIDYQNVG